MLGSKKNQTIDSRIDLKSAELRKLNSVQSLAIDTSCFEKCEFALFAPEKKSKVVFEETLFFSWWLLCEKKKWLHANLDAPKSFFMFFRNSNLHVHIIKDSDRRRKKISIENHICIHRLVRWWEKFSHTHLTPRYTWDSNIEINYPSSRIRYANKSIICKFLSIFPLKCLLRT